MVSDSAGNLYVAGRYYFSSGPFHRFVRRSTDGGATGSTAGNQVAVAFATDSNGNLYVAGWASTTPSGGTYYWIVRKNPGGTSAWTTVDDFTYGSSAEAHAIVADGLGNLFVGGQGSPASGGVHWLVRKN